ncbi:MAG: GyrI-like domain-containing protein [Candidatus Thorarchaeota archaeon]
MSVVHKLLEETLVACMRIHGNFNDIAETLEIIKKTVGTKITGDPIIVHHWLVQDKHGHDIDVCVPVSETVDSGEVKSMTLESCEAMTMVHGGTYETIRETYRQVTTETYIHGLPIAESGREVLLSFDAKKPEETIIEIQEVLHDWDNRFSKQLEKVLGENARSKVLECYTEVSHKSSTEERAQAVKCAVDILDEIATEDQKFEILSSCAHVFPPELVKNMRVVYVETQSVEKVLEAMASAGNYPKFTREGNILYSSKQPYNRVAYDKATTREEKMKAYCFCPMIKHNLDEVSGTFCYCGSGWSRRLWEGILGKPVKVEIVKSLTKDDDECTFAVHLPEV